MIYLLCESYKHSLLALSDDCLFNFLFWSFSSPNDFLFLIKSNPIDESDHLKVASYWLEYGVQDEVIGCTLVMYFHTAMVNIKSNILVVFASYLYRELFI